MDKCGELIAKKKQKFKNRLLTEASILKATLPLRVVLLFTKGVQGNRASPALKRFLANVPV